MHPLDIVYTDKLMIGEVKFHIMKRWQLMSKSEDLIIQVKNLTGFTPKRVLKKLLFRRKGLLGFIVCPKSFGEIKCKSLVSLSKSSY